MRALILGLILLLGVGSVGAEETPPERGPRAQLRKLGQNLAKLDLTPQQQRQVKSITDEMLQKLEALKQEAQPGGDRPMEKLGAIMGDARSRLGEVLTPQQQMHLRDLMQADRAGQVRREADAKKPREAEKQPDRRQTRSDPPRKTDTGSNEPTMGQDMMGPGVARAKKQAPAPLSSDSYQPIEVGAPAPDFAAKSLADKPVSLAAMKGRVVVLIFGSYTCPSFRQRVGAMEKLARDTSLKATFVVVYTREAHALGEWEVERNKDETIEIEQPQTDGERRDLARLAVNTLQITQPVIVDDQNDTLARGYGVFPNGAVVIGREGTVAARQRWFEPLALRGMIDAAAAVPRKPAN